jgi:hypothetical protein
LTFSFPHLSHLFSSFISSVCISLNKRENRGAVTWRSSASLWNG